MRKIKYLIIHCSATPEGREHTAADICRWHKQRGFRKIGYHYTISIDGIVEGGRGLKEAGAHTIGRNSDSIGVCYIGGCDKNMKPKNTLTNRQNDMLKRIVGECIMLYPDILIAGHNQFSSKSCPSFDVEKWCKETGINDKNIYKPK